MAPTDPLRDFELLIKSRYGVILLETGEEDRAQRLTERVAEWLQAPLFVWRRATGLRRLGAPSAIYGTHDPHGAAAHVAAAETPALYLFHGLGEDLSNPAIADLLRVAAETLCRKSGAIVLSESNPKIPEGLRRFVGLLRVPAPTREEYKSAVSRTVCDLSTRMRVQVALTPDDLDRLVNNLQGLTLHEAEKLVARAVVEDGRLDAADVDRAARAKKDLIERDGLLEFCPADRSPDEIADLTQLRAWLAKRKMFIETPDKAVQFGLDFPKGVLLVGVPGCGKSLCAKAVAAAWALPLVKLDPGALYAKYVGETEENFRRAMSAADRLSPMVLWIDEIEKAFATGGEEDGGVSRRVLGSFLSWMQERQGQVFIVATANDVSRLPPEFMRKGRFDEIFFVDLPDEDSRAKMFEIQLRRRKHDPAGLDLPRLGRESEGYSGAEIEQVIVSALYTAFSGHKKVTTELLLAELAQTPPIASTMREKIAALREWAEGRTVPAN